MQIAPLSKLRAPPESPELPDMHISCDKTSNPFIPCSLLYHRHAQLRASGSIRQFTNALNICLPGGGNKKGNVPLTSRADTNWRGRRATFKSGVLVSRSLRAVAKAFSRSEGLCLEGLFAAILLAAMVGRQIQERWDD